MAREMKDSGIAWIGEIPNDWNTILLKHVVKWKSIKNHEEAQVLSLYRDYGVIPKDSRDDNHNVTSLDTSGYKFVEPGDLVINKMKAWQGSIAVSHYEGIVSPAYHVCEITSSQINKMYLHYLLRNPAYLPEYMRLSTGMRVGQWDLGFDDFINIPIVVPSLQEQETIVRFINSECARIDAVMEQTRASIEEYKKLKQAFVIQSVTKGIRHNQPMKKSRIEWIDIIPQHWKECRIKNVVFPMQKPVRDDDEIITCFRDGVVTLRRFRREEGFTVSFTENGYQGVDVGDLVIHGMDAFAGAIGCSDSRGKTTPVVHVCHTAGNNRFFMYFLRSMAYGDILMDLSNGVRIRSSDYRNFYKLGVFSIVVPPLDEQNEIVLFLDRKMNEITQLIVQKENLLTELELYKKSLIYEYVTGKKEVAP